MENHVGAELYCASLLDANDNLAEITTFFNVVDEADILGGAA